MIRDLLYPFTLIFKTEYFDLFYLLGTVYFLLMIIDFFIDHYARGKHHHD